MAVVGVKGGKPTFNSEYDAGVYESLIPHYNGKRMHPTQKPEQIFSELVLKHSNYGDLVIDPFMGSGTTGVAAVKNGRLFAGCDIYKTYVDISCKRITDTYKII